MSTDYYDLAQNVFFRASGLLRTQWDGSERLVVEEAAEALRELQPSVRYLRKEFRKPTPNPVYSGPNAFAYLLAYVPVYIHQSWFALEFAGLNETRRDELRVGLFCCGPCPEVVGLLEVRPRPGQLPNPGRLPKPERLCLDLFDNGHEGWGIVRKDLLSTSYKRIHHRLDAPYPGIHDFNIIKGLSPADREIVAQLDVAMFQNFDNELGRYQPAANQTIEEIAQLLPHGSKLILSGLWSAMGHHNTLETPLRRYGKVMRDDQQRRVPSATGLTRQYLLDDSHDCKPRTNLNMNVLVLDRASVQGS